MKATDEKKGQKKGLTREEEYMLYAIGQCYKSFDRLFSGRQLSVSISKAEFIDIMISSSSVSKHEREIYKNLETLEEKGYLKYDNRVVSFTRKGFLAFRRIDAETERRFGLVSHVCNPRTIKLHRKLQARLLG